MRFVKVAVDTAVDIAVEVTVEVAVKVVVGIEYVPVRVLPVPPPDIKTPRP